MQELAGAGFTCSPEKRVTDSGKTGGEDVIHSAGRNKTVKKDPQDKTFTGVQGSTEALLPA